jgi:bacteriochlorophyll 4-vinyl reductase
MRESGIGRVLVASLHEAIADVLPMRLAFYESWLTPEGLRDGTIGLAPLYAVLSFLRQEGDPYRVVTAKAGGYAVEWTIASMPAMRRRWIRVLPKSLRRRVLLRRASEIVRMSFVGSSVKWRMRKGTARVRVHASLFCDVREPVPQPLCVFYAAIFEQMASHCGQPASVSISSCRAVGAETCELHVSFGVESPVEQGEAA